MPKPVIKDIDRGAERVLQALGMVRPPDLRVGIVGDEANNVHPRTLEPIVDIATMNELGTDEIPSRPFLRQWFDALKPIFVDDLRQAYSTAIFNIKGQLRPSMRERLEGLGDEYADAIRESILKRDADLLANAEFTVARKGEDRPLVETGLLADSISYEVD